MKNVRKFWNWIKDDAGERILRLEGPIDEESFWGDEITPKAFRDELNAEEGDVTVWLNSPGGNVFAASEIYTMLRDYKGKVTVKIDAIAASAASVVAMAGDHVAMSPTSMIMIHDPSTIACGNTKDMEKAITVLNEVKESILNAYCEKSGLSRTKVANLMSNETWMNAKKAVELGFADEVLFSEDRKKPEEEDQDGDGKKPDEEKDPDEEGNPDEDGDDSDGDDGNEDGDEEEKKKPFRLSQRLSSDLAACMYSSRQMGLTILNRLGVDTIASVDITKPGKTAAQDGLSGSDPTAKVGLGADGTHKYPAGAPGGGQDLTKTPPPDTPVAPVGAVPPDTVPVIGLDGKTADGSMPYRILMDQLECMR